MKTQVIRFFRALRVLIASIVHTLRPFDRFKDDVQVALVSWGDVMTVPMKVCCLGTDPAFPHHARALPAMHFVCIWQSLTCCFVAPEVYLRHIVHTRLYGLCIPRGARFAHD